VRSPFSKIEIQGAEAKRDSMMLVPSSHPAKEAADQQPSATDEKKNDRSENCNGYIPCARQAEGL
jgi:hypothetical protein